MDSVRKIVGPETASTVSDDEWEDIPSNGRVYHLPPSTSENIASLGRSLVNSVLNVITYPVSRASMTVGPSREEILLNNLKKPFDDDESKSASCLHINEEHAKILLTMRQTLLLAKTSSTKFLLFPRTITRFKDLVHKHNLIFLPNTYELIKWRQYIRRVKSSLMFYLSSLSRCPQRIHLSLRSGIQEI